MVLVPGRDDPVSAAFSGVIAHDAGCVAFGLTLGECLFSLVAVYKMYKKGKPICVLLFIFGGAQCAAMAINARLIITGSRYSPTCVILSPHHSRIYVG
jgi:hypothetical protein